MKKTYFFLACISLFSICKTLAQAPTISDGSKFPAVGTTAKVYGTTLSGAPDSSGAGHTWDFSKVSFVKEGIAHIISVSSSPYKSNYPDANFCTKVTDTNNNVLFYDYGRVTSKAYEQIATNVTAAGPGTLYTDYETECPFPFHYQDQVTDTFQKKNGSANTVVLTYDSYGDIIMPWGTIKNVVRVKRYWGVGDYGYEWWSLNPTIPVLNYDNSGKSMVSIAFSTTTSLETVPNQLASSIIYPNPSSGDAVLKINGLKEFRNVKLTFNSLTGQVVKQINVSGNETTLPKGSLAPGVYFYHIENEAGIVSNGKFIVQ